MPKIKDAIKIPIGRLHPNEWNPNVQSPETFNELVKEIEEDGFEQPLNVVPCPDFAEATEEETAISFEGGECKHFTIIGGEHRHRAAKVLGYDELPCYVHTDWNDVKAKLKTVRRNILTGKLDDSKFTSLVDGLTELYDIDKDEMARLMGFDTDAEFARHYIEKRAERERSFIDDLLAETQREKYAVDALSDIIATIFAESGETVEQNFMHFAFKGSLQTLVLCDAELLDDVKKMVAHLKEEDGDILPFMKDAIAAKLAGVVVAPTDESPPSE